MDNPEKLATQGTQYEEKYNMCRTSLYANKHQYEGDYLRKKNWFSESLLWSHYCYIKWQIRLKWNYISIIKLNKQNILKDILNNGRHRELVPVFNFALTYLWSMIILKKIKIPPNKLDKHYILSIGLIMFKSHEINSNTIL